MPARETLTSTGVLEAGGQMRRVLYRVAASLDGYIAGPRGEVDWIAPDPAIDLSKAYEGIDTVLLGRRTYELTRQPGAPPWPSGWQIHVFSRTLAAADHPAVMLVSTDAGQHVAALRAASGQNIWLFGGASLFKSLLESGQVDVVQVLVVPVLLGGGVPLVEGGAPQTQLALEQVERYPSGMLNLRYQVADALPAGDPPTSHASPHSR
jgi:dihydrofolate reductase